MLTIAIPTYNGALTLAKTLESIVHQLEAGVEVLVSDNASTDETDRIVAQYPEVRYVRNAENVGFDRNVDQAVRLASHRHVWLCSDDELILPGGIQAVLGVLGRHPELGVLLVNYTDGAELACPEGRLCASPEEFLTHSAFKSGLLSANVVAKPLWEAVDPARYAGSGWIHFGFLVEGLTRAPSYVIGKPWVEKQPVPARWGGGGDFFRVGLELVTIFSAIMPRLGYAPATVRRAVRVIKGAYYHVVPRAKAMGLKVDRDLLRRCCDLYRGYPSFWLLDLPLLLLPGWFYRPFYLGYRALRSFRGP